MFKPVNDAGSQNLMSVSGTVLDSKHSKNNGSNIRWSEYNNSKIWTWQYLSIFGLNIYLYPKWHLLCI